MQSSTTSSKELHFSFAAAGWLHLYHFGVCRALQELGLLSNLRCSGSSGGALAAAAVAGSCDFDEVAEFAIRCSHHCRSSWRNVCNIRAYVRQGVAEYGVEPFRRNPTAVARLNTSTNIYVSILPWCRSRCFSHFETLDDLEEALIASCCITPLAGFPFRLRKTREWVCDGGLTAFQPCKGEIGVITVSPLYFTSADIRPSAMEAIPVWWGLYPPSEADYRDVFHRGFNDALHHLVRRGLVPKSAVSRTRPLRCLKRERGWFTWPREVISIAVILALRALALVVIYMELLVVSVWLLVKASVLGWLPRRRGRSWREAYHSARNVFSLRVLMRILFGRRVPINHERLGRYSRAFRIFEPLMS